MTDTQGLATLSAALTAVAMSITSLVKSRKNGNGAACLQHLALEQQAGRNTLDIQEEKKAREKTETAIFAKLDKVESDTTAIKIDLAAVAAKLGVNTVHATKEV